MEIADEVEQYAREWGRHARLDFVPTLFANGRVLRGTWRIRFTLRDADKRLKLYREGRVGEPPTEDVWLHEPNPREGQLIPGTYGLHEPPFRPLDLYALGASGVRQFLERGNTWGRGRERSFEDAIRKADADRRLTAAKTKAQAKEAAAEMAERRAIEHGTEIPQFNIPLTVSSDSSSETTKE